MTNDNKAKVYYWIKLKDTFLTSDKVDFLMSQKDGANYIVLYQMICLKAINTNGELARSIGEMIIPFDEEKIQRDCKYFSIDTVRIALELYKKLGMVYRQENGILKITDFENMVGKETRGAIEKREQRQRIKELENKEIDKQIDNVYQEIRDKSLDIRDIDNKDKDLYNNKENIDIKEKSKRFSKPTIEEVKDYCLNERHNNIDWQKFYDYYESNGWKVGKNPMKDWKASVRTWERNTNPNQSNNEDWSNVGKAIRETKGDYKYSDMDENNFNF